MLPPALSPCVVLFRDFAAQNVGKGRQHMTSTDNTTTRTRDWIVTVKAAHWDSPDDLANALRAKPWAWVFSLERGGKTGYEHYQLYVQSANPIAFATLKKLVSNGHNDAHLEPMRGTPQQCIEYCTKSDTHIAGPWFGSIDFDLGHKGLRSKKSATHDDEPKLSVGDVRVLVRDEIMQGATVREMREKYTPYWSGSLGNFAADCRGDYLQDQSRQRLSLSVNYLYGGAGVGKSSGVRALYNPDDVYVVSDYKHPFDLYDGQPVVIFEEFSGGLDLQNMLQLLDLYPTQLPARYANKWVCYTTIWLITNLPLDEQYKYADSAQRAAFARRVGDPLHMLAPDIIRAGDKAYSSLAEVVADRHPVAILDMWRPEPTPDREQVVSLVQQFDVQSLVTDGRE